jgi:drug/metabolite transporter (DMT)-like permease
VQVPAKQSGGVATYEAFAIFVLTAGSVAVAVRYSNRELDPLAAAGIRFAVAGAILGIVVAASRMSWPRGRALVGAAIYGTLTFAVAPGCAYLGLEHVHAGLGQTILALIPLLTLLLAAAQGQEHLTAPAICGVLLALGGVAFMSDAPLSNGVPVAAIGAFLLGAIAIAEASVLVRRFPPVSPIAMNATAMLVGSTVLLVAAIVHGETIALPQATRTWLATAFLIVPGGILPYVVLIYVLNRWTASRTSYAFVLLPIVTLIESALLDSEPLRWQTLVGGGAVLTGVYVGALRRRPETLPIVFDAD